MIEAHLFQEKELEEQKSLATILSKTPEARGRSKAYNILTLLAKKMKLGSENWNLIIDTFSHKLSTSTNSNILKTCNNCLDSLVVGLGDNANGSEINRLSVIFLIIQNYPKVGLKSVVETEKKELEQAQKVKKSKYIDAVKNDCYLLERTTKTKKVVDPKLAKNTTLSLLIEFALKAIYNLLKKTSFKEIDNLKLINQMVPVFIKILETDTYVPIIGQNIKILQILLNLTPLPVFDDNEFLKNLLKNALNLLTKFGRSDKNQAKTNTGNELSNEIFKLIHYLLELLPDKQDHKNDGFLQNYELLILLRYCTEDLLNDKMSRKQNAFVILNIFLEKRIDLKILNRKNRAKNGGDSKILSSEDTSENFDQILENFHEIFKIVLELSINSNHDIVRTRASKLFINYINLKDIVRLKVLNNFTQIILDNAKYFSQDSGNIVALTLLRVTSN